MLSQSAAQALLRFCQSSTKFQARTQGATASTRRLQSWRHPITVHEPAMCYAQPLSRTADGWSSLSRRLDRARTYTNEPKPAQNGAKLGTGTITDPTGNISRETNTCVTLPRRRSRPSIDGLHCWRFHSIGTRLRHGGVSGDK
jgi:hypothetical protein